MKAKREYRNREDTEVAVLDALVDRKEEGMSVFELRARVDVDIDHLETALGELKEDDLITAEENGERTVIRADERVIPNGAPEPEVTAWDRVREILRKIRP